MAPSLALSGLFLLHTDITAVRCYDQPVAPRLPMSEEQLKAFLEKVKADTSLQEKLKAATDSDAVLAIAKEAGFSISADDLKNDQLKVSDEELEEATGGLTGTETRCGYCVTCVARYSKVCAYHQ